MFHTSPAIRILDLIRLVVFGVRSYQTRCHERQKTSRARADQTLKGNRPTVTWVVWRYSQEAWVQSHDSPHQTCVVAKATLGEVLRAIAFPLLCISIPTSDPY